MLHNILPDMEKLESRLRTIVPEGYMLALNIRHLTPEFLQSTYPSDWVTIYTDRRYVMFDPVVTWARFNVGATRWGDIPSREVLGARNAVHAVAIATRRGLIFTEPTF